MRYTIQSIPPPPPEKIPTCTCVDFLFQIIHFLCVVDVEAAIHLSIEARRSCVLGLTQRGNILNLGDCVGVSLWVSRHGDTKFRPVMFADELYQVQRAREPSLCGCPFLLTRGRVAPQRHNVPDTPVVGRLESSENGPLGIRLARNVCARQVHVGDVSGSLSVESQIQAEVGGRTSGPPRHVRKERVQGISHSIHASVQALTRVSLKVRGRRERQTLDIMRHRDRDGDDRRVDPHEVSWRISG
jgi:hypothetical protein